jgi:hypothetical protein
MKMQILTKYITHNPFFNDGRWITGNEFKGFFLHSVGCAQPNPLVFIRQWDNANYGRAGINGFIGADAVYLTAPCLETPGRVKRMPHAGKPAGNNGYIGFEMCEPAQIHYTVGASFIVRDHAAAQAYCRKTYQNAVQLFARLCSFHGKNPLQDGVILSHNEGGKRGIASGHVDPEHLWRGLSLPYTMEGFRRDVANAMKPKEEIDMTKAEVVALIDARIQAALEGKGTEASAWAKDEFAQAVAAGITDGTRPGGYAKREEVAAMVLRGKK